MKNKMSDFIKYFDMKGVEIFSRPIPIVKKMLDIQNVTYSARNQKIFDAK